MLNRIAKFSDDLLQFVLFSNMYIAVCAVIMCQTTAYLFRFTLPVYFLSFIFMGTLGSYSLHWYLTDSSGDYSNRGRWNQHHKTTLLLLFICTSGLGLWLLNYLRPFLLDLLPVVFLTFLYTAPKIDWRIFNILRRIAVLKSVYLALVWTYVTAAIPLIVAKPFELPGWVFIGIWLLNRFLFIYSIALWFDYRDRAIDRQSKWLTMASMLPENQIRWFFYSIIVCFGLTVVSLYEQGLHTWTIICLSVPMILLGLTAQRMATQPSDYIYYIYFDGLLMLSGVLLTCFPS
ncbi:hypothetical protein EXU85_08940 [Spirosoma sp. KCTC 42546]|uniref:hypothetical protein n=1 Tax=Spirosoma sp. KCTC 42546 TaxID=2520506 RepID=UPI00115C0D6C|nr:hypothetical protein [Spirosoma sp. KCTC 42546]QDK78725.1 hypothetical protein EXU85_08940 [Spirosoma sp. KCTC 42546]